VVRKPPRTMYEQRFRSWALDLRSLGIITRLPFPLADGTIYSSSLKGCLFSHCASDPRHDSTMHATDPRDLIFALLGIRNDTESLGLVANYTKSPREVFTDAAAVILCSGDLSILSCSQFPKHISKLAS